MERTTRRDWWGALKLMGPKLWVWAVGILGGLAAVWTDYIGLDIGPLERAVLFTAFFLGAGILPLWVVAGKLRDERVAARGGPITKAQPNDLELAIRDGKELVDCNPGVSVVGASDNYWLRVKSWLSSAARVAGARQRSAREQLEQLSIEMLKDRTQHPQVVGEVLINALSVLEICRDIEPGVEIRREVEDALLAAETSAVWMSARRKVDAYISASTNHVWPPIQAQILDCFQRLHDELAAISEDAAIAFGQIPAPEQNPSGNSVAGLAERFLRQIERTRRRFT